MQDLPKPALFVVGTPIGNLEDISFRAIRVLKESDLIACEDTRQTQKLLNHYGIATKTVSYHEHNERERAAALLAEFDRGARVALVTDAGMPAVSDPGFWLVTTAIEHQVPVIPIPGPTAFVAALVAGGLPAESFQFSGFLPSRHGQRRQALEAIRESSITQIFYEAPHRVRESLADIVATLGPSRQVVVAREITKIHEEFLRGRAEDVFKELNSRPEIKGEITLLIGKAEETSEAPSRVSVAERVRQLMLQEQIDQKAALKKVAKELGISKSEAYRELQRGR